MMKLAVPVLSLFLVLSLSQAKTNESAQVQVSRSHSALKTPMRTKSVLVRAVPKAQRRLLITNDLSDGDDGPPGSSELDLQVPYRRPELIKVSDTDDDLSDYVKTRLLIARVRALAKYQETWT
jgi:hypothetical protein